MKPITYRKAALGVLAKLPPKTANRIRDKIRAYAADPSSQANNVKALRGQPGVRLRVGDWRVIMLDGEVVDVIRIGPRGSIYE